MLRGIRLIIYDLDGTLIDSTEAIVTTFNKVLDELKEPQRHPEEIIEMIGLPIPEMFKQSIHFSKHPSIQWAWNRYAEIYNEVAPRTTFVLPTVRETLEFYKKRGLIQSIATTKRRDVAAELVGKLRIASYFDLILGINDVKHPKPDPDIVLETLTRLGVLPDEAILVEDTSIGLMAGRSAGVKTVAVTTGTHDRQRLESAKPDYIIDRLENLKEIIVLD